MADIQAAERSGATPAEDRINMLMNAAVKQKDVGAETFALERLVMYYPKKEYWVTLLNRCNASRASPIASCSTRTACRLRPAA
jgi:hypothetical protein